MATIHIDGVPGPKQDGAIGVSVNLDEATSFAGVSRVQWDLFRPARSSAALTKTGLLFVGPFTNTFTPDVPGGYRLRLTTYDANGVVLDQTETVFVVYSPHHATDRRIPAPGSSTEIDSVNGWAHDVESAVIDARDRYLGNDYVTVINKSGGAYNRGSIVQPLDVRAWPKETGGGSGAIVSGVDPDYVLQVTKISSWMNAADGPLFLLTEDLPDGAVGRALRRGLVPYDTSSLTVNRSLHIDGSGSLVEAAGTGPNSVSSPVVGYVRRSAAVDADPPGLIWFDPSLSDPAIGPNMVWDFTLNDNVAVATNISATLLSWANGSFGGVMFKYYIRRGSDVELGTMLIDTKSATGNPTQFAHQNPAAPGITFSVNASAGIYTLQYTSTSTGSSAQMRVTDIVTWEL